MSRLDTRYGVARTGVLPLIVGLLGAWPISSAAAVVNIDVTAGLEDLRSRRDLLATASPEGKDLYTDWLSVVVPPITVKGGDTINFRVVLEPDLRFGVDPVAGGAGVGLWFEFSNPQGASIDLTGDPAALFPAQNVKGTTTSPLTGVYWTAFTTGILTANGGILAPDFFTDPSQLALLTGFSGSLTLPAPVPQTTFDKLVSLGVIAGLGTNDEPPTMVYLTDPAGNRIPEPAVTGLVLPTLAIVGRRRRRAGAAGGRPA
jgi:hypothetical protein